MVLRRVRILDNAVDSSKIAADTIVAADIATGAVGTDELAALAVTTAKIAGTNVTAAKLLQTDAFNLTSTSSTYVGNVMTASSVSSAALAGTITKTTQLASAGTQSGYFLGFFNYPADQSSTVIGNTIVSATSRIFVTAVPNPVVSFGASASAGSITVTASSVPGTVVPLNYMVITPS